MIIETMGKHGHTEMKDCAVMTAKHIQMKDHQGVDSRRMEEENHQQEKIHQGALGPTGMENESHR